MPKRPRQTSKARPGSAVLNVRIELPSDRIAGIVSTSLRPEAQPAHGFRSTTSVRSRGRVLELEIQARDLVALRASANSFLRLVAAASKTVDTVAPFYRGRPRGARLTQGRSFE